MFVEEFRKPWFEILEVIEPRGRSMADIAMRVAARFNTNVSEIRGRRQTQRIAAARRAFCRAVYRERPDLSTSVVADFLGRDRSTVRHMWCTFDREPRKRA